MKLKAKIMSGIILCSLCCGMANLNVCASGSRDKDFKIHFGCRASVVGLIDRELRRAAKMGDLDRVRNIREDYVIWQEDRKSYGQDTLLFASKAGKLDIVKYIVENGFFMSLDNWEDGPLFAAIENYRFNVIEYLLSKGFRFVYPWWYGRDMEGKPASLSDVYGQSLDCWDFFEIENIFKSYGLN